MGYGLFANKDFGFKDRLICAYHGKHISRRKAYFKKNESNYIVELINHYGRGVCFNKSGNANDSIGWEGGRGKWNAEFIVDDYDSRKSYYGHYEILAKESR